MKKFVAIFEKSQVQATKDLLLRHVEHLKSLRKEGKLFLCGPFTNGTGVIQILVADNYEEADALVRQDPFTSEGYFLNYTLYELIEANEANNYLLQ